MVANKMLFKSYDPAVVDLFCTIILSIMLIVLFNSSNMLATEH